jgi:hypothetical protein
MKFLPLALISLALAATACTGSATLSGTNVGSVSRSAQPKAGLNAGQDVSDLGSRPNPPVRKGGIQITPVPLQPQTAPMTKAPAVPPVRDRCSNETGRVGKAQPMCLPA